MKRKQDRAWGGNPRRNSHACMENDCKTYICIGGGPRKGDHRLGSNECWEQCYTRYSDSVFFAMNPGRTKYWRKAVPRELGIDLPRGTRMLVEDLGSGWISRTAYRRGRRLPIGSLVDNDYDRHVHLKGVSLS